MSTLKAVILCLLYSCKISAIDFNKNLNSKEYLNFKKPVLPNTPSMTSYCEQMYLYWLTSEFYQGKGAIVELGPLLGASTGYIGAGLRDSGQSGSFYVYDRFKWFSEWDRILNRDQNNKIFLKNGDDFSYIVKNHLASIFPAAKLIKTELDQVTWHNKPIELMHIDAPKDQKRLIKIFQVFGPSLIPGKSVIVMQDFSHPPAYALPLILGCMSESFEVAGIPNTTNETVVFKYKKSFDFNKLSKIDIYKLSKKEILHIWCNIMKNITNVSLYNYIKIGLALYFYDIGNKKFALKIANDSLKELSLAHMKKIEWCATMLKKESIQFFLNEFKENDVC